MFRLVEYSERTSLIFVKLIKFDIQRFTIGNLLALQECKYLFSIQGYIDGVDLIETRQIEI